jgi:hypothetical protein
VRRILLIFLIPALLLVCTLIAGVFWTREHSRPPTDAELLRQFFTHRAEFEKLHEMLQANPAVGGEEYDSTVKKARVLLAWAARDASEYVFLIKRWGFAGSGWGIAVVYRTNSPANVVPSLNEGYKSAPREGIYQHIDGNWYLWMK